MNYIQRLFDSTAPIARGLSAPVAPTTAASSPVVAADQRFGVFPGLVDPFEMAPGLPATGAPPDDSPAPAQGAQTPDSAPPTADSGQPAQHTGEQPRQAVTPEDGARRARSAPDPEDLPPRAVPAPMHFDPRSVSPLQRLVERDPLTERRSAASPEPAPPVEQPVPAPARPAPSPAAVPRAEPTPATLYRNPAEITPDQFRPRAEDGTQASPPERRIPAPPPTPAETVPSAADTPAPATPLQPATDDAPSPFARQADIPPAPAAQADTARPVTERIIERIREVHTASPAPSAPPKAMTATAQSVIGPLSLRRSGGWQPRQDVF